MTTEQEKHLQQIKDHVCQIIDGKYRKGAAEHGGNLNDMSLDWFEKEIENEIVDLIVYFVTKKLKQ